MKTMGRRKMPATQAVATSGVSIVVVVAIYALTFLATIVIIFIERSSPSATLAWLIILWVIPGLGLFFYMILSQPFIRLRMKNLSSRDLLKEDTHLQGQIHDMKVGAFKYINQQAMEWRQLIRCNQAYAGAVLTQNNKIDLYTHGKENFTNMFREISEAREVIHVEYFIIKPDELGLAFIDALAEKAREGVEVRLLMDAMGSRGIKNRHLKALKDAGGEAEFFLPGRFFRMGLNFNYRNHRKLVVIDKKIAYLGGLNVAKEYVGISKKFKGWRDTNIRIVGDAVYDVDRRFMMDWNYASKQNAAIDFADYKCKEIKGDAAVQIVSCGPENPESEIKMAYLKMMDGAVRRLYIQTPYFVPDSSIYESVRAAALSGVDVRIMIPFMPDHPFVYWVTYQNVGELLDYGVKVYIYNKGFLHSKTVTVDGEVSSVGSANFDIRSFDLNFETNAIIYDWEFAKKMEEAFENDMINSTRLTKEMYENRSGWIRFKASIGRLLSGIL